MILFFSCMTLTTMHGLCIDYESEGGHILIIMLFTTDELHCTYW